MIGFISLDRLNPELSHTIISLSLYHRLSVIKMVKNKVIESKTGRCFNKLKTKIVSIVSLGIIPYAARRKT